MVTTTLLTSSEPTDTTETTITTENIQSTAEETTSQATTEQITETASTEPTTASTKVTTQSSTTSATVGSPDRLLDTTTAAIAIFGTAGGIVLLFLVVLGVVLLALKPRRSQSQNHARDSYRTHRKKYGGYSEFDRDVSITHTYDKIGYHNGTTQPVTDRDLSQSFHNYSRNWDLESTM